MRSAFLTLLILGVAQTAVADDFYPLAIGTQWTYKIEGKESKLVMTATGAIKIGEQRCVQLEATVNGKVTGSERVAVLNDGVYRFMAGDLLYNPPICFLKPTAKKGDSWKQDYKIGEVKGTISFTVNVQEVAVPAGKFSNVVVVRAESTETGPKTKKNPTGESFSKATIYYAKGVGMIKQVFLEGDKEVVLLLEKTEEPKK